MKDFNEKHEAIIESDYAPIPGTAPNHGEISPHHKKVTSVKTYSRVIVNGAEYIVESITTRDFIMDLARQIEEIESVSIHMATDLSPF